MPQIIFKERTAHLASYTFFTRDVDQYKNMSLSQLYQPPRTTFSQITDHIAKFLRTAFYRTPQETVVYRCSSKWVFLYGKHLCWSIFLKNMQAEGLQFHKRRPLHRCFPVKLAKFLRTPFLTKHF